MENSKKEEKKQIESLAEQIEVRKINTKEKKTPASPKIIQKKKLLEIPEKYKNDNVIAKLEIPAIELETYVIGETDANTLSKSVTKLCGPDINKPGNVCITGHNYIQDNMFHKLRKLSVGDTLKLTDIYGICYVYEVYEIEKVFPNNLECLNQETEGERHVTLITCTIGAQKRLIVKAKEVYD